MSSGNKAPAIFMTLSFYLEAVAFLINSKPVNFTKNSDGIVFVSVNDLKNYYTKSNQRVKNHNIYLENNHLFSE